ncbi:MAG: tetratricopeptide repeat protein [Flavobacteriaceae bacterium]|nr:tetratricopeptide repeat protein [Flavobacteriaceae bacterium]MBL6684586.1 tetratricopeptide repeat protein [Flavobacteriaceae bacterium]
MFKLFLILFFLNTQSQVEVVFDEGNALYNQGNYAEAIEKYTSIINNGSESAELYYNLGNAYYKINDIANSIFYFEKSLLLDPNNNETINNLLFSQNMTIDRIETVPVNQVSKFISKFTNLFDYNTWFLISILFEFLSLIVFSLYLFNKNSNTKKRYFSIGSIFLFCFIIFLILGVNLKSEYKKNNPAILFDSRISFKSEPNERSEELFLLNEGTKVNVLEKINEWSLIELSNGSKGWILNSTYQLIK